MKQRELDAKIKLEQDKLEKQAHQPPLRNLRPLRILDWLQNLRKKIIEKYFLHF